MQFEPIGGFPPIIRADDTEIREKTLESRGFATTNIVSISNIMDNKKKENLFIAFGTEDEDGVNYDIGNMFDINPHKFNQVKYKKIRSLPKTNKIN